MAIEWHSFDEGTVKARLPILMIAKYPGTNNWTDAYVGWRERLVERPENEFARWPHDFPPTHWALVTTPDGE